MNLYLKNDYDETIGPFKIYRMASLKEIVEILNTSELRIRVSENYRRRDNEKIRELIEENRILRGPKHRRFGKTTIDNWESYIVDNFTGEKYGQNIDTLLFLLNTLSDRCINDQLKDTEKIMKRYYSTYSSVDPTFGGIIKCMAEDLGVDFE